MSFPGSKVADAELQDTHDDEPVEMAVTGAPVEKVNPLGREVTLLSAVMLNVGRILGSGIFAVPGVILNSVGSIGMLLIYWIITPLFAFAGLSLYAELASMFPNRSGAEIVYLEQAYPRPRFFVPSALAVITLLTSTSVSNAAVFSQYFLSAFEVPITAGRQTSVALGVVFATATGVILSTKWSLRVVTVLTIFKVLSLVFIVSAGMAVLGGLTQVENPWANFHRPFEGSTFNANALSTAFIKSHHTFLGWNNAFDVLGEIKGHDPVRTARKSSHISLFLVSFLFIFINIAYVAAVPKEDIRNSGQLIALLFFRRVFGSTGSRVFPLMVACSCFGNIIATTVCQARTIREVARQGLLPYPGFFSSTKPFGTPSGPVLLRSAVTILVIVAIPAKDSFNFVLDLVSYPHLIFYSAMAVGVWRLRARRRLANISPSVFQARNWVVSVYLISCLLLILLPWVPPEPGHADVSFWYATYCVAGIVLFLCCGLYSWLWIIVLPKYGGYEIVEEVEELPDGARNTKLVRRYRTVTADEQPLLGGHPGS